jgi:plastocyanin
MCKLVYGPLAAGALMASLVGCGGDGGGGGGATGPGPGPTAAAIAVVSGDGQTAQRGSELGQALVVRVTDSQGSAVSGATVEWTVSSGSAALSIPSSRTNSQGEASVELTLSYVPGESRVTGSVAGVMQSAGFTATATDPGPLTITVDMLNTAFVTPLGGDDITIKLGDTVEWVNRDAVLHTATSTSVPGGGSSLTWIYFCEVHPTTMRDARITVVQ